MMFTKRILPLSLLALVLVVHVGCAPTIVGTNMGVYRGMKLYSVSDKDVDTVYKATLDAMAKLQLDIKSKAKDVFSAKVVARSADGKDITVDIRPIEDNKTKYTIQVGSFGNEARSRMIFTEIKNILMAR
jgi:hypothetical protein